MKKTENLKTTTKFICKCLNTGMTIYENSLNSITSPGSYEIISNTELSHADGFPIIMGTVVKSLSASLKVTDSSKSGSTLKNGTIGQSIDVTFENGETSFYRRSCVFKNGEPQWGEWLSYFDSDRVGDLSSAEGVVTTILSLSDEIREEKERSVENDKCIANSYRDLENIIKGVNESVLCSSVQIVQFPARIDGSSVPSGYFKGYQVDLTEYRNKYNSVYFRGAEWNEKGSSTSPRICRGLILDNEGNIESIVAWNEAKSNGWQELPLTSSSATLWATYCFKEDGGEVWTPEYVIIKNKHTGLIEHISNINNRLSTIESSPVDEVQIILPNDIYVLRNRVTQLFFRGFIKSVNPYNYDIKVMCAVGKTFTRYYEIGVSEVGDYPLKVQVRDNNLNVIAEKETTLHIIEQISSQNQFNVLCVGASATATGYWPAELRRMLESEMGFSNVHFVGRKTATNEFVNLEATGGWSWINFISTGQPSIRFQISETTGNITYGSKLMHNSNVYTVLEVNLTDGVGNIRCSGTNESAAPVLPTESNGILVMGETSLTFTSWEEERFTPFFNTDMQCIDFKTYADTYCNGQIDVLVTHLGVNNALWDGVSHETAINAARILIDAFLSEFPTSKIVVSAIPMPDEGVNVYANTYSTQNVNRYGTICSFLEYNKALYTLVSADEYIGKVFWAPSNLFFDTDYGYPKNEKNVNNRISSYKELVGTNGVHPIKEGSYMIADSMLPVFLSIV